MNCLAKRFKEVFILLSPLDSRREVIVVFNYLKPVAPTWDDPGTPAEIEVIEILNCWLENIEGSVPEEDLDVLTDLCLTFATQEKDLC